MNKLNVLDEKNMLKLLLKLSLPAMTGMFVMALYNIVDTIFVGQGVGSLGIAGLTIVFPFQMIITSIGISLGVGTASLISRSLGAKNYKKAENSLGTSYMSAFIITAILTLFSYIFLDNLLHLFGATKAVLPYSKSYMSIILIGNIPIVFSMIGNNVIRSEGNAKMAMFSMLIGAVVNILLDPLFIFHFKMGVAGAATASVIAQFTQLAFIIYFFSSGKSILHFKLKSFLIKFSILKEIVSVGFSSFARLVAGSFVFILINNAIGKYGDDNSIAIFGISVRFTRFVLMPVFGIAQGFQPIAGYNFGAKRFPKIIEVTKLAIISSTAIITFSIILSELFPTAILKLFSKDPLLISSGAKVLRIMIFALPVVGFQAIGTTLFQALGKALPAIILSMSRQILILIPLILILPRYYGVMGVWISNPISDIASAILTFFFYKNLIKQLKKL